MAARRAGGWRRRGGSRRAHGGHGRGRRVPVERSRPGRQSTDRGRPILRVRHHPQRPRRRHAAADHARTRRHRFRGRPTQRPQGSGGGRAGAVRDGGPGDAVGRGRRGRTVPAHGPARARGNAGRGGWRRGPGRGVHGSVAATRGTRADRRVGAAAHPGGAGRRHPDARARGACACHGGGRHAHAHGPHGAGRPLPDSRAPPAAALPLAGGRAALHALRSRPCAPHDGGDSPSGPRAHAGGDAHRPRDGRWGQAGGGRPRPDHPFRAGRDGRAPGCLAPGRPPRFPHGSGRHLQGPAPRRGRRSAAHHRASRLPAEDHGRTLAATRIHEDGRRRAPSRPERAAATTGSSR